MPELPTGTVTFLFTDIEGSTQLLQKLGSEYGQLQDQHASILRTAIADGDGVEIRTEGDAFFAVFPTPSGALRAAVAAQRDLASFPWPEDRRIRVRMGLHTGEGTLGGDDYLGIEVNRAARIAATGHGGQVVISEATAALVSAGLPEGVSIRDVGRHQLKDFEHPEHLHDLVIDGLLSDFPTLRSMGSRRTNLSSPRTSFVGRSREIVEIGELLDSTRLLTLTGPGGTGKTRLALKVAWARLDRYRDGVYFVDLSSVTESAFVIPEIARALRVRETPGRDLAAAMQEHLRERELLLVLDNLEQLIHASPVVGTLLEAAPKLVLLATSRIPLRLSGEQEYPVSPLALPELEQIPNAERIRASESVELFVERAAAVRPGLRITDESAPMLMQIVSRLDGLPLALELAGSRMRVLSLDGLASRLEQRLPLLTGGPRDAPERQRTLEATIAWSHDLLHPHEKRLFARLSVFVGGWTLEAAETVCGTDLDALDGLGSLVDDSLVRRIELADGGIRFTMLETIREFAAARLADVEQEREDLQRRHAEFFRDLAERAEPKLTGEEQAMWLQILEQENDNLRAALDRCEQASDAHGTETGLRMAAAIWRFWQQRGRMQEGRSLLERLLTHPTARRRDAIRVRALGALGGIAYWQSDHGRVPALYEEAVVIAREVGDRRLLSRALFDLSFVEGFSPQAMEGTLALLQESLAVAEDDDLLLQGQIWTAFGFLKGMSGDRAGAAECIERALALQRKSGDRFTLSESLTFLAGLAHDAGDIQEARRRLGEATPIAAESSSPVNLCTLLIPYAILANDEGRYRDAARLVGAYNRIEEDYDVHLPQAGVMMYGDPGERARAELGDGAFELARQEGFALSLQEAFAALAREASIGEASSERDR